MMKKIISERNCVILLFAVTFLVFAFAQEDGKRLDKIHQSMLPASTHTSISKTDTIHP